MPRRRQQSAAAGDAPTDDADSGDRRGVSRNEVVLCGRVAAEPLERELPSGDSVVTARIIVDRDPSSAGRSSQRVDTLDCVGWTARVQRSMRRWTAGDEVEVHGAIRRRFYRAPDGPRSRVEVEIVHSKRIRRAGGA